MCEKIVIWNNCKINVQFCVTELDNCVFVFHLYEHVLIFSGWRSYIYQLVWETWLEVGWCTQQGKAYKNKTQQWDHATPWGHLRPSRRSWHLCNSSSPCMPPVPFLLHSSSPCLFQSATPPLTFRCPCQCSPWKVVRTFPQYIPYPLPSHSWQLTPAYSLWLHTAPCCSGGWPCVVKHIQFVEITHGQMESICFIDCFLETSMLLCTICSSLPWSQMKHVRLSLYTMW